MTSTATLTAAPARLVGFRLNELNAPLYRVTPLADGMERVEYLVNVAHPYVYGQGTPRLIHPDDLGVDPALIDWSGTYADHLRIKTGEHRARLTQTPEQAALAARHAAQTGTPGEGDRFVVALLSGYQPIQNRPLEHRHCHCGNGVTTYAEGTVTGLTCWADNSVDVHVQLDTGESHTVQIVAPHGDAC